MPIVGAEGSASSDASRPSFRASMSVIMLVFDPTFEVTAATAQDMPRAWHIVFAGLCILLRQRLLIFLVPRKVEDSQGEAALLPANKAKQCY